MRKILMILLFALMFLSSGLAEAAPPFPFNLEIRTATGTASYTSVTPQQTNPFVTVPVEISNPGSISVNVGSMSLSTTQVPVWKSSGGATVPVTLDSTGNVPVSVTSGTMSLTGTLPLGAGSATVGSIGAIISPLPAGTNALGSVSVSNATTTKILPFTTYAANIATNTQITMASIASFSAGNFVSIRAVNGRIYWAGNTSKATASAILGDFVDTGDLIGFTAASDTTGLWGSSYFITTTAASIAIRVWPTQF